MKNAKKGFQFKTLRLRIGFFFSLIIFILLLTTIIVTGLLLDDFYIARNRTVIKDVIHQELAGLELGDAEDSLKIMRNKTGGQLFLLEGNQVIYPTDFQGPIPLAPHDLKRVADMAKSDGDAFVIFGIGEYTEKKLVYARFYRERQFVLLIKGLGAIEEANDLTIQMLLIALGISYVIGVIVMFWLANRLSKPIKKMEETTKKIADLNFTETLDDSREDEVGALADSINRMAHRLDLSISQLSESNERLEQELMKEKSLEKMRRRFVSDVSHELKNPLSMIQGYADGLLHNIPKTDEDKKYYQQTIFNEAVTMTKLIKDLLDLSSYESGVFSLNKADFNISILIDQIIEKNEFKLEARNLKVQYHSRDKEMIYNGDELRISQVINNLLDNSIKHAEDNSNIIIELYQSEHIILTVKNKGDLIPKEHLADIFNSFYQVDNTKSGSGLGLAIVKSIVDLHKGTISAFIDGEYNCFRVEL